MSNYTNTVDSMGDAAICKALLGKTLVEITDTHCTTIGGYAFYKFYDLRKAIFENATRIEQYAFAYCSKLETVEIPLAENVGYFSFYECTKLKKADFPNVKSVNRYAFNGSTALETLVLRSTTMATLLDVNALVDTRIEDGKGYIYVPSALIDSYKADSKWSTYANQFRVLEHYTVDGTITGEIDPTRCRVRFFNGDTLLQEIYVPYGTVPVYTGDEPTDPSGNGGDFIGWSTDIAAVTCDIDYIAQFKVVPQFAYLEQTTTQGIAYVVSGIGEVTDTDIVIPSAYNGKRVLGVWKSAFKNNTSITSLTAEGEDRQQFYDNAFEGCSALRSIAFNRAPVFGSDSFKNCTSLESVRLGNGSLSFATHAFNGCANVKRVYISDFYEWCRTDIPWANSPLQVQADAYINDELATNVIFPSNLTKITTSTFRNWKNLQSIEIHDGVTEIGGQSFQNCANLVSVKLPATPPTVQAYTFNGLNSNCVFYIPTGSLAAYQSATNWSTLTNTYSFVEEDR